MHVSSEHYGVSVLYGTVFLGFFDFALKRSFLSGAVATSPRFLGCGQRNKDRAASPLH